jgi:hypothetical protein
MKVAPTFNKIDKLYHLEHLYNKFTHRTARSAYSSLRYYLRDSAWQPTSGNGTPFSTVIGSSSRVTIRGPAGGNRDNLTGVDC